MPIYAYKCDSCGFAKDVLQKMSDAPLADCPQCGTAASFKKQLTAAGFQLKGSGWYVTDFRGGANGAPAAPAGESGAENGNGKAADTSTAAGPVSSPAPTASTTAAASPAPAPAAASSTAKDSS